MLNCVCVFQFGHPNNNAPHKKCVTKSYYYRVRLLLFFRYHRLVVLLSSRFGCDVLNDLPINWVWLMRWVGAKYEIHSVYLPSLSVSCSSCGPCAAIDASSAQPLQQYLFCISMCMFSLLSFCLRISWFGVGGHSIGMHHHFSTKSHQMFNSLFTFYVEFCYLCFLFNSFDWWQFAKWLFVVLQFDLIFFCAPFFSSAHLHLGNENVYDKYICTNMRKRFVTHICIHRQNKNDTATHGENLIRNWMAPSAYIVYSHIEAGDTHRVVCCR